ncbi:methyl-accepting chemotaxis protein [Parvibium lacunae]|nr:methyl-accepting chemotaxis protein [Parvibium lacunae]
MFNQLKVRTQLTAILVVAVLGMIALQFSMLFAMRDRLLEDHKKMVRGAVDIAVSTASHFYKLEKEGKLDRAQAQEQAKQVLRHIRYAGTEYFYIYNQQGINLMHAIRPDFEGQDKNDMKDPKGRPIVKLLLDAAVPNSPQKGFSEIEFPRPGDPVPVPKLLYTALYADWGWVIGSGIYLDDIKRIFVEELIRAIFMTVLATLVVGGIAMFILKNLVNQIGGEPQEAQQVMQELAAGNLSVSVRSEAPYSILSTLGKTIGTLRETMTHIRQHAEQVASESQAILSDARTVAAATQSQTGASQHMASSIQELASSISQVSELALETESNSISAAHLAGEGEKIAADGATEMRKLADVARVATQRMDALVVQTNKVEKIANVIKDIAAQTNLLALNAAIEAARAGEQGRGFAVVADEVRSLAERTAEATVQITKMIQQVQTESADAVQVVSQVMPQVDQAVKLVSDVADKLRLIRQGATSTVERTRSVAEATREQSNTSQNVSHQVEEMSQMIENTNQAMQRTSAAVSRLDTLAADLRQEVAHFKT